MVPGCFKISFFLNIYLPCQTNIAVFEKSDVQQNVTGPRWGLILPDWPSSIMISKNVTSNAKVIEKFQEELASIILHLYSG